MKKGSCYLLSASVSPRSLYIRISFHPHHNSAKGFPILRKFEDQVGVITCSILQAGDKQSQDSNEAIVIICLCSVALNLKFMFSQVICAFNVEEFHKT